MSPTVRTGLIFGLGSVVAFIGALFIPVLSIFASYAALLALGWGAGYTAAKTSPDLVGRGTGRGAAAGALAGVIHLILLTIFMTVAFSVISRIPDFQNQFQQAFDQAKDTNPELRNTNLNPNSLMGAAGVMAGLCFGIVNLIALTLAGIVGGAMWQGTPNTLGTMGYPPAGQFMGTPPMGSQPYGGMPPTGTQPYGNQPPAAGQPYGSQSPTGTQTYPPPQYDNQPPAGTQTYPPPATGATQMLPGNESGNPPDQGSR